MFLSGGMVVKKFWIPAVIALLLSGCGARETFETVADDLAQPAMAQAGTVTVELPDDAVTPVLEQEGEQVYLCQDYELIIQTQASGDLNGTIRAICGFDKEDLTVIQTQSGTAERYDFVWACAGEGGDRLGRAVILDDGNYHYCMSVLRDADTTKTSQIVWSQVFDSFCLA